MCRVKLKTMYLRSSSEPRFEISMNNLLEHILIKWCVHYCIMLLQLPANDGSNASYFVSLLNMCTMHTEKMKLVNNSSRFQIPNPHNWTNITIVAENMCSGVTLPVNFNNTCTQVNDSIVTSNSSCQCYVYKFFAVECPTPTMAITMATNMTGKS